MDLIFQKTDYPTSPLNPATSGAILRGREPSLWSFGGAKRLYMVVWGSINNRVIDKREI